MREGTCVVCTCKCTCVCAGNVNVARHGEQRPRSRSVRDGGIRFFFHIALSKMGNTTANNKRAIVDDGLEQSTSLVDVHVHVRV